MGGCVLLITSRDSLHANAILKRLLSQGEQVARVNLEDFHENCVLDLCQEQGRRWKGSLRLLDSERVVDLANVKSVHFHQPGAILPPPDIQEPEAALIGQQETQHALMSLYGVLEAFWINDYFACRRSRLKPVQLLAASRIGLPTPHTIITSEPAKAVMFAEACGEVIVKVLGPPSYSVGGWPFVQFSERLTIREVRDNADLVSRCPTCLQEYVPKAFEVRATVVGEKVFAARLDSQAVPAARIDWRRADDTVPHDRHEVPRPVADKLVELNRHLGMFYGAMDLIVTPGGEYVFLETNPAGAWLWLEDRLELPISEALAAALAQPPPGWRS